MIKAPSTAIATLKAEASALENLVTALEAGDEGFTKALELILAMDKQGRIIVTGVGKSGHIGGKIAATFASTGTPAFFVHATEAEHGDLGMITEKDVVLAISHSGETKELASILEYTGRFDIPLIALTGRPESTLAKAATVILNNRVQKEACPLEQAPTTSSTASLALADALATELMAERNFTREDFARYHPGGKLGAQLKTVREIMIGKELPLLASTVLMGEAIGKLTERNLGCIGLVEEGRLVGIITDGDLKRRLIEEEDLLSRSAKEVMTRNPKIIEAEILATKGVHRMNEEKVKALWVVDEEKRPIGLFRMDECLQAGVI